MKQCRRTNCRLSSNAACARPLLISGFAWRIGEQSIDSLKELNVLADHGLRLMIPLALPSLGELFGLSSILNFEKKTFMSLRSSRESSRFDSSYATALSLMKARTSR